MQRAPSRPRRLWHCLAAYDAPPKNRSEIPGGVGKPGAKVTHYICPCGDYKRRPENFLHLSQPVKENARDGLS
jgi:hypothetical protein